jgi:hypothetical protein
MGCLLCPQHSEAVARRRAEREATKNKAAADAENGEPKSEGTSLAADVASDGALAENVTFIVGESTGASLSNDNLALPESASSEKSAVSQQV